MTPPRRVLAAAAIAAVVAGAAIVTVTLLYGRTPVVDRQPQTPVEAG